ncbi:LicD family protein [Bisgaard Taxon 10/6]|uniref:LicD family protein n=1 Tax=Exercitatus varius TaxID=67857 RepID=UPI00294AF662|nr:LicD family protein [Exercitatus varius]MDG2960978.1 LicD family protein [Exercitatus varius]
MKKQLSLDEIKQIELQILIEFREICNELGLRYYLSGGTLLGAIRHKGFIPWDDDIDLAMPRSDFNKLIEFSQNYQNDTYKFLFFGQDGNLLPYAKFVNTKTHIDAKYIAGDMQKHLWLDIMPMDGLPDNLKEVTRIYKKAEFYRKIILLCESKLGVGKTKMKKLLKYVVKPFALLYGKKRAIANLNQLAMTYDYDSSKYVGAITWGLYGASEKMLKAELDEAVEVIFENNVFTTFSCWDSYLRGLYQDYMKLPSIDKRGHHEMIAWTDNDNE